MCIRDRHQNNRPNNTPTNPSDVGVSRLPFQDSLVKSQHVYPNLFLNQRQISQDRHVANWLAPEPELRRSSAVLAGCGLRVGSALTRSRTAQRVALVAIQIPNLSELEALVLNLHRRSALQR